MPPDASWERRTFENGGGRPGLDEERTIEDPISDREWDGAGRRTRQVVLMP